MQALSLCLTTWVQLDFSRISTEILQNVWRQRRSQKYVESLWVLSSKALCAFTGERVTPVTSYQRRGGGWWESRTAIGAVPFVNRSRVSSYQWHQVWTSCCSRCRDDRAEGPKSALQPCPLLAPWPWVWLCLHVAQLLYLQIGIMIGATLELLRDYTNQYRKVLRMMSSTICYRNLCQTSEYMVCWNVTPFSWMKAWPSNVQLKDVSRRKTCEAKMGGPSILINREVTPQESSCYQCNHYSQATIEAEKWMRPSAGHLPYVARTIQ